ncbi:MAG: TetR/AcrR family transcriptional regulator [Alphaproteobacteria bacterium]|nr:TetR/AcrR family transcriptional regulator [Alphaproteobacteria bacterium]
MRNLKVVHPRPSPLEALEPRRRGILEAAYGVLLERGYAGANTLEIARRARVSKRELYAEFGNKSGLLRALISATAGRMRIPLAVEHVPDANRLRSVLRRYGTTALTELTRAPVLALNRLAIAEAGRSNEMGRILEQDGREPNRRALIELLAKAKAAGVLTSGEPETIAGQFFALLMGDLMMRLLLGVIEPPPAKEIRRRAESATSAVLALYGTASGL